MRPLQCVGDDPLCFQHVRFCGLLIFGTINHGVFKDVLKVFAHGLSERNNGG